MGPTLTCTVGAKKSLHFVSVARNERNAKMKTKRRRAKTEARNETELVIKTEDGKRKSASAHVKLHNRDRETVNKRVFMRRAKLPAKLQATW